ncbi:MAG: ThuA domain-containing protein [Candidatus Hydrogenedentes bacterium]|nr:ThuA domain-containing protein [Candidatus Hydrogenedentota bacterium]
MGLMRCMIWTGILTAAVMAPAAAGDALEVVILSGQNNHAWPETTPQLRAILEEGAGFRVAVLEQPERMTADAIAGYDAILSNWNSWGEVAVKVWPAAAREALIGFVEGGKGFVSVHAGSSSFYDWAAYQALVITAWDLKTTGHGKQHEFTVTPSPIDHPITRGLGPFSTFDELWHGAPVPPEAQVLATAHSAAAFGGTGKDEPVLFTRTYGAGRSVNLLLGHHVRAMSTPAFGVLLRRSVAWSATGQAEVEAAGALSGASKTDGANPRER